MKFRKQRCVHHDTCLLHLSPSSCPQTSTGLTIAAQFLHVLFLKRDGTRACTALEKDKATIAGNRYNSDF